jgi:putative flippase GtrA
MLTFIRKEWQRFLLVGFLNTLFGYAMFSFFIFLKIHYTLSVLLATIVGVLFNFKTFGKWVFYNSDNRLLLKFILVYIVVYVMNIAVIKILLLMKWNIYLSGGVSIVIAALVSYFLNKKFVFQSVKKQEVTI